MIDLPKIQIDDRPDLPVSLEWASTEQLCAWRETLKRIYSAITAQLGWARSTYQKAGYMPSAEYGELCDWQRRAKAALGHVTTDASRVRQEFHRRQLELRRRPPDPDSNRNRYRDLLYALVSALEEDPAVSAETAEAAAQFLDFIDADEALKEQERGRRLAVHEPERNGARKP